MTYGLISYIIINIKEIDIFSAKHINGNMGCCLYSDNYYTRNLQLKEVGKGQESNLKASS